MIYRVVVAFVVDTDNYHGVHTEAQVERLVAAMMRGEANPPETMEITATLPPIRNEGS